MSHVQDTLKKLRTGKAHSQLLDPVRVEAYGTTMGVQELASITVSGPDLLIVKPYDKSQVEAIEKAIQKAGLNLNPVIAGDEIKVPIPQLTEERRKDMVKTLMTQQEDAKVMLRNVRSDIKQEIEALEGSEGVSEDDLERLLEELDKRCQSVTEDIEKLVKNKETELLTI